MDLGIEKIKWDLIYCELLYQAKKPCKYRACAVARTGFEPVLPT